MSRLDKPGDTTQVSGKVFERYFSKAVQDPKRVVRAFSHADGSCLWHALVICMLPKHKLVHALNPDSGHTRIEHGHALRKRVRQRISKASWNSFWTQTMGVTHYPTAKSIIKSFDNTKTWSDVYMIVWAGHVLDCNIVFFDGWEDAVYCGLPMNPSKKTMLVWWKDHSHFEPVIIMNKQLTVPIINSLPPIHRGPRIEQHENAFTAKKVAQTIFDEHGESCAGVELEDVLGDAY